MDKEKSVDITSCHHIEEEIPVQGTGKTMGKVNKKNFKSNYDAFRKAALEVEKEKLEEDKNYTSR